VLQAAPSAQRRKMEFSESDPEDAQPLANVLGNAPAAPENELPELLVTGHTDPAPLIPTDMMIVPYPFNKWALNCSRSYTSVTTQAAAMPECCAKVKKYQFKAKELLTAWAEANDKAEVEVRVAVEEITIVKTMGHPKVVIGMGNVVTFRFCPDEYFVILSIHGFPSGTGMKKAKCVHNANAEAADR
jgi:hypothetical protein